MTQKEKKYLSVSTNPKYWEIDKPVLLAGKWCLNPNKKTTENLNITVMENDFFNPQSAVLEADYCNNLYENILEELTIKLNKFHKINWSIRAWRIAIGPWLNRYIAVINNRINILDHARKDYEIHFKNINFENQSLISKNIVDFSNKSVSEEWNEKLIRRLDFFYNNNISYTYFNHLNFETFDNEKISLQEKISSFFGFTWNKFASNFLIKPNNYLFKFIYIGNMLSTFMLYLNLFQFPLDFFFSKKLGNYQFIKHNRYEFIFQKEGSITNKERLIRLLLPEMIPTLYIEGFSNMQKTVKKHNLPSKQINIYTCNAWNDTIFKFWLSEKINNGSKLIYGQHGAGYQLEKKI